MNILIVGKFTEGQFGFHISDALREMGHNSIQFDPTTKYKYSRTVFGRRLHQVKNLLINNLMFTTFYREYQIKRLKRVLFQNKIELTISTHDFLLPEEVELIKQISKCPVVLWFPDPVAYFSRAFFLISNYDYIFFKDPYLINILRSNYNKNNVYYLPECCNPKYHKNVELNNDDRLKYGCDITTYGSPHNVRSAFFTQLLEFDYKIKIWGPQTAIWLNDNKIKSLYTGEYVYNESKAKSVLASKINLNTLHPAEIYGLNARTFEIAGVGGFQMIHWRPGLEQLFDDGKELVSFKNFSELIEKINYYLNNDDKRETIAKVGKVRAYNDHTYAFRLQLLLKTVFENGKGFEMP